MNTAPLNSHPPRFVSNSTDSVRMFRHDWMEALSKVHWTVPLCVFTPIIIAALVYALRVDGLSPGRTALWFAAGVAIWTPIEYVLHRFFFHYHPKAKWAQRAHFIIHGVHHDYPSDARRLVMPPSASVPIASVFYLLFYAVLPQNVVMACFAGFGAGYMMYDLMHYGMHHVVFTHPWLKALKRHHMLHHYSDPSRGYGVSTPFWDLVAGTLHRKQPPGSNPQD